MLKNTKEYTPADRQILAQDLNTFGTVVRMLNNITGRNVFVDTMGIHFREPAAPVPPALPVGELDGMVYQNTSQNTGGFADVRLVNRA
jgi:hypothetical protein